MSPVIIRQMDAVEYMATTIVADEKVESHKQAYHTIGEWIEDHRYHIVGAPRELYYGSPENGDYTAEIQFPVAKGER